MYGNYEFYTDRGGSMTVTEYNAAAEKAAERIDYYTFGRAKNAPESMKEKIQKCECELADMLHSASQISVGISSESNDGVSVSYSQSAVTEAEREVYNICRRYLTYPCNLMYAGGDGYA